MLQVVGVDSYEQLQQLVYRVYEVSLRRSVNPL